MQQPGCLLPRPDLLPVFWQRPQFRCWPQLPPAQGPRYTHRRRNVGVPGGRGGCQWGSPPEEGSERVVPQPGPGPRNGVSGQGGRPRAQKRLCQVPFFPAPRCGQRAALIKGRLWISEAKRVGKPWEASVKEGRAAESQRSTAGTTEGGGPRPPHSPARKVSLYRQAPSLLYHDNQEAPSLGLT